MSESERIEKILSDIMTLLKKGREREYQIYPRYYESYTSSGFTTEQPEVLVEINYFPRTVTSVLSGKQYTMFYHASINIYKKREPWVILPKEQHVIKSNESYDVKKVEQKLREILSSIDLNDIHYITVHLRKAPYSLDPTLNLNPDATRPFNPFLP